MKAGGRTILTAAACLALSFGLAGCGGADNGGGGIGIPFIGNDDGDDPNAREAGIGVNSFLWRASLDTLNFMPLSSADPFGGVIITDWYTDPQRPQERYRATVYILDTRLRADALNVSVFRQELTAAGWQDLRVSNDTAIQIENAILTRARQLRLSTIQDR